jgi:hypothetical protein
MKLFSSLHDPKKGRYVIFYTVILVVVMITVTLVVTGILKVSPIEGTMIFFEGFVVLFMLSRHEKVSHSFSNHISQINLNLKNCGSVILKLKF